MEAAVQAGQWPAVIELLEANWARVLPIGCAWVSGVLAATPAEVVETSLMLTIWQAALTEAYVDLGRPEFELPHDSRDRARFMTRTDASTVLLANTIHAVELRRRGHFGAAVDLTDRLVALAAPTTDMDADDADVVLTVLRGQWAVTYLLAGDFETATNQLHMTYLAADRYRLSCTARAAAAYLALIWAISGDGNRIGFWLDRAESIDTDGSPPDETVRTVMAVGQAFRHLQRLETTSARRLLSGLDGPGAAGEMWSFSAYAHVQCSLLEKRSAVGMGLWLRMVMSEHQATLVAGTTADRLTRLSRINLARAASRYNELARLVHDAPRQTVEIVMWRMRLAVDTGDAGGALKLMAAHEGLLVATPIASMCALLCAAEAHLHTGDVSSAVAMWDEAGEMAEQFANPIAFAYASAHFRSEIARHGGRPLPVPDIPVIVPAAVEPVMLTDQERRVLGHLVAGMTREEIAVRASVSINTVKSHLRRIYRKLGVTCRADAIAAAQASPGLLGPVR